MPIFRLYNLEPDRTVTGGAWYSDQDFESEFVEILNQQCYRFLQEKQEESRKSMAGPLAARNMSLVTSLEVHKFISELVKKIILLHSMFFIDIFLKRISYNYLQGISKVQLRLEDIEAILETLVFDGKVEKNVKENNKKCYRSIERLVPTTGLVRIPCGVCPVSNNCGDIGAINPTKCVYLRDWLS